VMRGGCLEMSGMSRNVRECPVFKNFAASPLGVLGDWGERG
jgi:hypothetical protein